MELARKLNITDYPSPARGCLLTDPIFSKRLHLAARGHAVWLTDRDSGAVERAAAHLRDRGFAAAGVALDVTSAIDIDAAVASLEPEGVDLLVNNAGLQHVAPLEEFPRERWELLIAVMLTGSAMLTRAVLPGMRQRAHGSIVNLASDLVERHVVPYHDYATAKSALVGFSRNLAAELGPLGIRVNCVAPGLVYPTDASRATKERHGAGLQSFGLLLHAALPLQLQHLDAGAGSLPGRGACAWT